MSKYRPSINAGWARDSRGLSARAALAPARDLGDQGQQVGEVVIVELKDAGNGLKYLQGRTAVTSALEPQGVVGADAREHGDFLPAQSGHTADPDIGIPACVGLISSRRARRYAPRAFAVPTEGALLAPGWGRNATTGMPCIKPGRKSRVPPPTALRIKAGVLRLNPERPEGSSDRLPQFQRIKAPPVTCCEPRHRTQGMWRRVPRTVRYASLTVAQTNMPAQTSEGLSPACQMPGVGWATGGPARCRPQVQAWRRPAAPAYRHPRNPPRRGTPRASFHWLR